MSGFDAAIVLYFLGMFQTAWMVVGWFHEAGRSLKPLRLIVALLFWPVGAAFITVFVVWVAAIYAGRTK